MVRDGSQLCAVFEPRRGLRRSDDVYARGEIDMSEALQRGLLLLGQGRHELAAEQFGRHLATEPNDAHAHSLLGLCLSQMERFGDATQHAEEAVRLAPDFPFAHYALAYVMADRNRFKEALTAINEA